MNTIDFYSSNASTFIDQYDQVSFEKIHHIWLQHIPSSGVVLDIGAGSGRDARYLSSKNLTVIAVEPAEQLLNLAKQNSNNYHIHWLNDSLPDLKKVLNLGIKFDLILLSAVWMHIPASDHQRVIRKISSLLKPNGKVIISLRYGPSPDRRIMYSVSSEDIAKYSSQYGLQFQLLSSQKQPDQLGRNDVSWETVILTLPDDGTGAFPLIRNIVVNDNKSSTYKLALLRSLLRIAEGHPGAVIDQTDDYITLPLGLVALYWFKLYKPLVDQYNMQQSSNAGKGLGFIKSTGWDKLRNFSNNDFYIGSCFSNKEVCSAIHQTIKDISTTIKNMPAKYIKLPGSHNSVFDISISSSSKNLPPKLLSLDFEYMKSFGIFVVPKQIWESFSRYSIWIEPALIHEWAQLMASYRINREKSFSTVDYLTALTWDDPKRSTNRIREKVLQLQQYNYVKCCWSGKKLQTSFVIDHAFPFARWPNNDLWNLLPTRKDLNAQKSDRLPTQYRLQQSKELITEWWKEAWGTHNRDEFFTQASFALPGIQQVTNNFDDVFDAMSLQRDRIKDLQQLQDWS